MTHFLYDNPRNNKFENNKFRGKELRIPPEWDMTYQVTLRISNLRFRGETFEEVEAQALETLMKLETDDVDILNVDIEEVQTLREEE